MKNKHHNYNSEAKTNTYSDSNWKQLYVSDAVAGSRTMTISYPAIQPISHLRFAPTTAFSFLFRIIGVIALYSKKKHSVKITECKTTFLKKSPSLSPSIIYELGILVGGSFPKS